ncbi:hypothetical protein P7C70_g2861, partial [Phenoliferia sp. Uapishka_3]
MSESEKNDATAAGVSEALSGLHLGQTAQLPEGWVREYDRGSHEMYYVDTHETPPKSTWTPPSKVGLPEPVESEEVEVTGTMGIGAALKKKLLGATSAERQLHQARRQEMNQMVQFSEYCHQDPSYQPRFDLPPEGDGPTAQQRALAASYASGSFAATGMSGGINPGIGGGTMGSMAFGGFVR